MDNRMNQQEKIQRKKYEMKHVVYRHFKGGLYMVDDICIHSETEEPYVCYHSVANPKLSWIRPLDMFLSKVDKEKYPEVTQEYRFEKVTNIDLKK